MFAFLRVKVVRDRWDGTVVLLRSVMVLRLLVLSVGWLDVSTVTLVHGSGRHVLLRSSVMLRLLVVLLNMTVGWSVLLRRLLVVLLGLLVVLLGSGLLVAVVMGLVFHGSLVPGSQVVGAGVVGSGGVAVLGVLMAFVSVVVVALEVVAAVGAVWVGAAGGVGRAVVGGRSVAHRVLRSGVVSVLGRGRGVLMSVLGRGILRSSMVLGLGLSVSVLGLAVGTVCAVALNGGGGAVAVAVAHRLGVVAMSGLSVAGGHVLAHDPGAHLGFGPATAVLRGLALVVTVDEDSWGALDLDATSEVLEDLDVVNISDIDVTELDCALTDMLSLKSVPLGLEGLAVVALRVDEGNDPDVFHVVQDSSGEGGLVKELSGTPASGKSNLLLMAVMSVLGSGGSGVLRGSMVLRSGSSILMVRLVGHGGDHDEGSNEGFHLKNSIIILFVN